MLCTIVVIALELSSVWLLTVHYSIQVGAKRSMAFHLPLPMSLSLVNGLVMDVLGCVDGVTEGLQLQACSCSSWGH